MARLRRPSPAVRRRRRRRSSSSAHSNNYISKTSWPILVQCYQWYLWGVGRAALGFGADWIKTVVTMAIYNGKNGVSAFSESYLIGPLSNWQVTRTGIISRTSSNSGRVGLFTTELFALERFHRLWMGKMVSLFFLSYYEFSLYQTYR